MNFFFWSYSFSGEIAVMCVHFERPGFFFSGEHTLILVLFRAFGQYKMGLMLWGRGAWVALDEVGRKLLWHEAGDQQQRHCCPFLIGPPASDTNKCQCLLLRVFFLCFFLNLYMGAKAVRPVPCLLHSPMSGLTCESKALVLWHNSPIHAFVYIP